ncbi:MAG: GntR family transcriptional regulator [Burkholderiaceae bacterium]|nr:GntR family transcriptional regulator [Burkholderiaceae bacterium]MEB2352849.1 GntR family transcriptional regulator [Burkholderiaceae bacterium]
MVASLEPVDRPVALGEQVYDTLRTHLRDGAIRAGQPLQEVQLATQLGVSRTPVREALARLASEGLLVSGGRSYMVPELTLADVDDIYEVRFLIEPPATRRVAARTADPEVRAPIEAALAEARAAHRAGNAAAFRVSHIHFRSAWLALVPNRRLVKVIEQYADHMQRIRALTLDDPDIRAIVLAGFERLIEALRTGDGDAAAAAMHAHLVQARRAFIIAVGLEKTPT